MIVQSYSMGGAELQEGEVFNETEMERLRALKDLRLVRYDGVTWHITVTISAQWAISFTATPPQEDFLSGKRPQVGFSYFIGISPPSFIVGEEVGLSFVRAFLNGYELLS